MNDVIKGLGTRLGVIPMEMQLDVSQKFSAYFGQVCDTPQFLDYSQAHTISCGYNQAGW